ncbi:MAG: sugar phosphate isomerase/epimerase family protein [Chloroflexota bacterium]
MTASIEDTVRRKEELASSGLELAGHPNLSANPDLGNLHRGYAEPEEPWHEAIERLVGRVKFWHVKNVQRTFIPELRHSFFNHATLEYVDIDYRWALARLVAAGFDGYLSIEGAGRGDFLAFAARGKAYLDELAQTLASGEGLAVQ